MSAQLMSADDEDWLWLLLFDTRPSVNVHILMTDSTLLDAYREGISSVSCSISVFSPIVRTVAGNVSSVFVATASSSFAMLTEVVAAQRPSPGLV